MRVLYLGDVVGRSGRFVVANHLPSLRRRLAADFVIVNGENAAGGFGLTPEICEEFYAAGADAILTGNHVWDQRDILGYIDKDPRVLRPENFPAGTPGRGYGVYQVAGKRSIFIAQVMGRIFMDPLDDPFACVDRVLDGVKLGTDHPFILVDVHGEATSEKMALGHHLDGRVSFVAGTHTHVPTADCMILPGGTAYQSDVGMCGDFNSVIGMDKEEPLRRFTTKISGGRFQPALGDATLCAVLVEADDATGLAVRIDPVRIGGRLAPTMPQF